MSAGKGDAPRRVSGERYRSNYDAIFNAYPEWICRPCGFAYGRFPDQDRISTYHTDRCGICGDHTACTEPRDFGHLRIWPIKKALPALPTSANMCQQSAKEL